MLRNLLKRRVPPSAGYSFYIWEDGQYRSISRSQLPDDNAAMSLARERVEGYAPIRPSSLDAPHLHVVREDGVHIITVDLPEVRVAA